MSGDRRRQRPGRRAGIYKRLDAGYPSSSLLSRARPELARLEPRDVFAAPRAAETPEERVIPAPPPATVRVRDAPLPAAATDCPHDSGDREPSRPQPAYHPGITTRLLPGTVRVTIELDREVGYRDERIGSPDRVFLDLRGTQPGPASREADVQRRRGPADQASGSGRTTAPASCSI